MALTRREVLELVVLTMGAAACGGSSGSGGMQPAGHCLADGTTAAIASNHGHALTVTKADVAAGVDKTYDIQGTSAHTHSVTISAAMFAQLAADMEADTASTVTLGHDHVIAVTCV